MGTNYYVHTIESKPCPHCGTPIDGEVVKLHIGKQSAGWSFLWHGHGASESTPWLNRKSYWQKFLHDKRIYDEYGEQYTYTQFEKQIVAPGSQFNGRPAIEPFVGAQERGEFGWKDYWRDHLGWSFCKGDWS